MPPQHIYIYMSVGKVMEHMLACQGGGCVCVCVCVCTPIDRHYSHNCDCSWSAVNSQKGTVNGQSVLGSMEDHCRMTDLGGITYEV